MDLKQIAEHLQLLQQAITNTWDATKHLLDTNDNLTTQDDNTLNTILDKHIEPIEEGLIHLIDLTEELTKATNQNPTTQPNLTYNQWAISMGRQVHLLTGFKVGDLAYFPSHNCWASGMTPVQGAEECIRINEIAIMGERINSQTIDQASKH